jgi:hypothetical protein
VNSRVLSRMFSVVSSRVTSENVQQDVQNGE